MAVAREFFTAHLRGFARAFCAEVVSHAHAKLYGAAAQLLAAWIAFDARCLDELRESEDQSSYNAQKRNPAGMMATTGGCGR